MPTIWVYSPNRLVNLGLLRLVAEAGFRGQLEPDPEPDLALWNLGPQRRPFPPPPPMPTLALLASDQEDERVELLRLGYRGYLDPEDDLPALKQAVEAVWRGEPWASRKVLAGALSPAETPRLTARESQVLSLVLLAYTNQEIAERLGAAEKTVKTHVSSILQKCGVRSRMELIARPPA